VHISAVEKAGLPGLNEGQTIEYEEVRTEARRPRKISKFSGDGRGASHPKDDNFKLAGRRHSAVLAQASR
jgi:hypothetical protein